MRRSFPGCFLLPRLSLQNIFLSQRFRWQRGAVQGLLASSLAWPQARRATRAVGDERGVSTVTLHTSSFILGALAPGITLSS